jgi:hypothetical protein
MAECRTNEAEVGSATVYSMACCGSMCAIRIHLKRRTKVDAVYLIWKNVCESGLNRSVAASAGGLGMRVPDPYVAVISNEMR